MDGNRVWTAQCRSKQTSASKAGAGGRRWRSQNTGGPRRGRREVVSRGRKSSRVQDQNGKNPKKFHPSSISRQDDPHNRRDRRDQQPTDGTPRKGTVAAGFDACVDIPSAARPHELARRVLVRPIEA